jgi:hypothetical protein
MKEKIMFKNRKEFSIKRGPHNIPIAEIGDCFQLKEINSKAVIKMSKRNFMFISLAVFSVFFLMGIAAGQENQEQETLEIVSLTHLSLELDDYIGKKVWVLGFYGDERFTGDGVGFLVDEFYRLIVDEQLRPYSYIGLDGILPPYSVTGAEIFVYGEVKDFAETYNKFTLIPTPLITIEKYEIVTPAESTEDMNSLTSDSSSLLLNDNNSDEGTKASACDRALIISGGVDARNNHARYKDNVTMKYNKLRELGFTDEQITVYYNDGSPIEDNNKKNIVDGKASKDNINKILDQYKNDMQGSCTLTIFVTDHGTGYNEDQGYDGQRPVLPNDSNETGLTYPENKFRVDLRHLVFKECHVKDERDRTWTITYNKKIQVEPSIGDQLSEGHTIKEILDCSKWFKARSGWDPDGDWTFDIIAEWDGTRYVLMRLMDGKLQEIGRDTNGDYVIDEADGGVDWNLDGDKLDANGNPDQIGFYEGINLWVNEVYWDFELAEKLQALSDKNIHIVIEMCQCFAGGFINNLKNKVEKIVTFSSEDTKHYNRFNSANKVYAADERAFIENLKGIDIDSWDYAFDKAKEADKKAKEENEKRKITSEENIHSKWERTRFESESTFSEVDGNYSITLVIPDELVGQVYDMEIFFGLQKPRWEGGSILETPEGFSREEIEGGIKISSEEPFPSMPLSFVISGASNAQSLRIDLTDKEHKNIGYIKLSHEIDILKLVIDDFESYTNESPNYVFQTWHDGVGFWPDEFFPDGYEGNGSGSMVGYDIWSEETLNTMIMEKEIVHSGRQSMPFDYYNEQGMEVSLATRTFDPPQDWSEYDILSLWIYGDPNNTGDGRFFIEINDQRVYLDVDLTTPAWQEGTVDLETLDVDIANIYSLGIGVGGAGASGLLFADDIVIFVRSLPFL